MGFVLTPLSKDELSSFFDETALKVIHYFLQKSIISQPEKINNQNDLPIHIPKEHIEQWIVQALGVQSLGAGSYPVDVISDDWGADVKMLSCKVTASGQVTNSDSGETSLGQKFSDLNFGNNNTLDDLFANKKYELIWDSWKEILINKYKRVEDDHGITNILYFIILRADSCFHLCGLKVDLNELENTSINTLRSTKNSVYIKNFINDDFGNIKVYKAKKRLELRLRPQKWIATGNIFTFNTDFEQTSISIREKIENNELSSYIENTLMQTFKTTE